MRPVNFEKQGAEQTHLNQYWNAWTLNGQSPNYPEVDDDIKTELEPVSWLVLLGGTLDHLTKRPNLTLFSLLQSTGPLYNELKMPEVAPPQQQQPMEATPNGAVVDRQPVCLTLRLPRNCETDQ